MLNYLYTNKTEKTHAELTLGKIYQRVDGFERDGVSKGFYFDDTKNFRLVPDSYFIATDDVAWNIDHPFVRHQPRAQRIELAKRWGVTEQTINNWQRAGEHSQPFRIADALAGLEKNQEPNLITLEPGQLSEIAQGHGFYISELSVRWGYHYGGETLSVIATDPNRVALFWDMLAGMEK